MEELTFSSQDAEFDCEVVVRAVDDLDQAVLDLLGDVKDSVEVQHLVVGAAELANGTDHQVLVEVP